ncbi:MAG: RNA-binding S4 domain-containing protein [Peptoniphilaceae bacterium]
MRIDKFLKVSRLIIRRTVAKQACEGGRVKVNDKVVKPSDEVKVGDIIEISFGNRNFKAEIQEIKEHVSKNDAESLYRVIV